MQKKVFGGRRPQDHDYPNPNGINITKLDPTGASGQEKTVIGKPKKKIAKMGCC
jgi:hypothetical protein